MVVNNNLIVVKGEGGIFTFSFDYNSCLTPYFNCSLGKVSKCPLQKSDFICSIQIILLSLQIKSKSKDMKDHYVIGNNGDWDIEDVPEQYTEKSFYVVNKMRNVLINYFKDGNKFFLREVGKLLQYAYELNHIISVLEELRNIRVKGHEMCLEDSVYGIMIMNHITTQRENAMKLWMEMRNVKDHDENLFHVEMGITHQMREPDLSSEIEQYVTSIWMIHEKMMTWIESCTKTMDGLILFFTQDCEIYRQFFINGYQDYWLMYRKELSDRLQTELYREDMFGEKILSMGKKPSPEHWGRALELKLKKLKADPTFSFMESFHRADKMFELTEPKNLPDIVRNRIGMSMRDGEIDDLSFDRMIHVFYRHVAEINILKRKMGDNKENANAFLPYTNLLRQMIDPLRESGDWKAILCPYRAAVIEGVLPKWPHKTFVSLMDIKVPSSSYSEWMNTGKYSIEELEPYSGEFQRLKAAIANPE